MQKTALCDRSPHASKREGRRFLNQTLLVMKLTIIFLTLGLLQVHAKGFSQQVTYSGNNVKLTEIIPVIKQQTGFFVISDKTLLDKARPVTVKAVNQPLEAFVRNILAGQPIDFVIENNTIVLTPSRPVVIIDTVPLTTVTLSRVAGRITNADGQPLQGVSIKVKGSTVGVSTDATGRFSIPAMQGQVLVISYVGMQQQEVKIKDVNAEIRVSMVVSAAKMDEFVVTGYSNVRKESFTGNATKIDREQILRVGNRNVLEILQVYDPLLSPGKK